MFNQPVKIGDKVMVVINNEVKELEVVSTAFGDPGHGKVSFLSPIAQALLGKRSPQKITVKLPNGGTLDCQLLKIAH